MKKIMFAALFTLFACSLSFAQDMSREDKISMKERAELATTKMQERYNLNTEQMHGVKTANLERIMQMYKIDDLRSSDKEAFVSQRGTIRQTYQDKLAGILDADQFKQYTNDLKDSKKKTQRKKAVKEALTPPNESMGIAPPKKKASVREELEIIEDDLVNNEIEELLEREF